MSLPQAHIVIGYNNRLISESLSALISNKPFYQVTGLIRNGPDFFKQLLNKKADFILIEEDIPNLTTLEYLEKIGEEFPLMKIMLIANTVNNGYVGKLMNAGLSAFILKSCGKEDLYSALTKIAEGKKFFCSTITQLLLKEYTGRDDDAHMTLTNRELHVLKHLVNGYANKEIASELKISESTVKTHRKNLMAKFGAQNLINLVRYACRENLVDFEKSSICISCPYHG